MNCHRPFTVRWRLLIPLWGAIGAVSPLSAGESQMAIDAVCPTPLFPRAEPGQPLRQRVLLSLNNRGKPLRALARVAVGAAPAYIEPLGDLPAGKSVRPILVTDIPAPTTVSIQVLSKDDGRVLATRELMWQPQKKWKIYCVSYSHQDLGYGGYPHRLRTDNRHANFDQALRLCTETDGWDEDSRYHFVVEASEALTTFLGSCNEATAAELARRVREGRIEIGATHSVFRADYLSHECMARLFYLTNRHGRDLLRSPAGRTTLLVDVISPLWPLATFCAEAGAPYFFAAHNECGFCQELESQPVCYWQGPGGASQHRLLVRSIAYGRDRICGPMNNDGTYELMRPKGTTIENIVTNLINEYAAKGWPYDALLSQDGFDFALATRQAADIAHDWNARFSHPRLISATLAMFFDDVAKQIDPATVKTYAKDGNDEWAEDSGFASALASARKTGETLPTAEKFATIAAALTPGGHSWTGIYQAYHSLLRYQEEANGAADWGVPGERGAQYYETEQQEYQEMVEDAAFFTRCAMDDALGRLAAAVTTETDKTLVVFNPLSRARSDVVRVGDDSLKTGVALRDVATGEQVACQCMPDGSIAFVANDVPSLGYRTFSVVPEHSGNAPPITPPENTSQLENRFYRIRFDAKTGAIVSIHDKELNVELVDQTAPHKFNEYLYEHFGSADKKGPTTWHRVESARLSLTRGPVADLMTVTASAAGAPRLEQRTMLYHDLKRVDFTLALDKSPSGRTLADYNANNATGKESVYVAMPLAVPGFRIHHELPGAMVEPIRQQFTGMCTAYYAIRHFTDLSNDQFGVTVSPVESALVEYGHPRSCPTFRPVPGLDVFEKTMEYPANSRLYLYLMNNLSATNTRIDQRGPMTFSWSLRSHKGDWKAGRADQFGWDTHNPLIARLAVGKHDGSLPAGAHSFVTVGQPNVVCTTVKPAEHNGAGLILRFVETMGKQTAARVSITLPGQLTAANETNLVEEDRPKPLEVGSGKQVAFTIRPFGVTTVRVLYKPSAALPAVGGMKVEPVSDREVRLTWQVDANDAQRLSQYRVYRGTTPDFRPSLTNLVQRPATMSCADRPQLNYGGWINNRLEPGTTYYYRVAAVDRWNNEGPISAPVRVTTLKSAVKDSPPLRVEGLRAFVVSNVGPYNYINLLWRTNVESDVVKYELHRGATPGFPVTETSRIAAIDVTQPGNGSKRALREYDHQMYADKDVRPRTTYYYRVCAVDASGQSGEVSDEATTTTKP